MCDTTVLSQDLIMEILSWVPVKALMRLRYVSKTWNSLIFDPTFVKLHLQRSSKHTHILLKFLIRSDEDMFVGAAPPCSIRRLLENPSSTIGYCYDQLKHTDYVFGSCKGLVCLRDRFNVKHEYEEHRVRFWNPATGIISEYSPPLCINSTNYRLHYSLSYGFGFDDWCDTYKVVVLLLDIKSQTRDVRIHCLGDTCWRTILTCPAFPVVGHSDGQFASGTVNWLTLLRSSSNYQWKTVTIDQLVIFSYDLRSETYKYLLMPEGLVEVPCNEPYLGVLKGCLSLSHDHEGTHFVLWLMREFGVQKSWTQLLKVSLEHLQYHDMPLCMSQDEDVMLLTYYAGQFSVKSANEALSQYVRGCEEAGIFNSIWQMKLPPKVSCYVWRILLNRLATKDNLSKRKIHFQEGGNLCVLCDQQQEDLSHLMFSCSYADSIWQHFYSSLLISTVLPKDASQHFSQHVLYNEKPKANKWWKTIWCAVVYFIWYERNQVIFNGRTPNKKNAVVLILSLSWKWLKAGDSEFQISTMQWISNFAACIKPER